MISGIILGFAGGIILAIVLLMILSIIEDNVYSDFGEKIIYIVFILLVVVSVIGGPIIGGKTGKYETTKKYESYVKSYEVKKETIENSLKNDNLTGLEKLSLVQEVTSLNSTLATKKVEYSKWYYWYLDKTLINSLENINLE